MSRNSIDALLADVAPPERNAEQPFTGANATIAKRRLRLSGSSAFPQLIDPESEARIRRAERDEIARELHDSTAQLLVALQLQFMRLKQPSARSGSEFKALMSELNATLSELHQEVRAVGKPRLHPVCNLARKLSDMAKSFAARTGINIEMQVEELPGDISVGESETLYRIAQEALANASRHAHAQKLCLSVGMEEGAVTLRVSDDGVGFSLPLTGRCGRGIANMSTRLHEVGGQLTLRNLPRGTLVEAKLRPRAALAAT